MNDTRKYWIETMLHIADPVLSALSRGLLRTEMPVKHHPDVHDRPEYTYLEALGRTLMGVAPWLNQVSQDAQEEKLRAQYAALSR